MSQDHKSHNTARNEQDYYYDLQEREGDREKEGEHSMKTKRAKNQMK